MGVPAVPLQLSLESTEVVEPRLNLDDEQGPGGRVVCQHVDPARTSRITDLHLALDLPPCSSQASRDECEALGVREVTLPVSIDEERRLNGEDERRSQGMTEGIRVCDGQREERSALDP